MTCHRRKASEETGRIRVTTGAATVVPGSRRGPGRCPARDDRWAAVSAGRGRTRGSRPSSDPETSPSQDALARAVRRQNGESVPNCETSPPAHRTDVLLLRLLQGKRPSEQPRLLCGPARLRVRHVPGHYAGGVCNVQAGEEDPGDQGSHRSQVRQVSAVVVDPLTCILSFIGGGERREGQGEYGGT